MLGIERYNDAPACLHSARSETDVVLYAFAAPDFETFVLKYPHAARYVAAEGRVTPDYQPAVERRDLGHRYLHEVAARGVVPSVAAGESIADAARRMLSLRADSILVTNGDQRARGVLTSDAVLAWVAEGAGNVQQPVETLLRGTHATVGPDASVADGVLAMGAENADAVAITDDGTAGGRVHALVTRHDLAPLFGENPATLLREVRGASSTGGVARAEPAGAGVRARAAHERGVRRLAGALHSRRRRRDPDPGRRARRASIGARRRGVSLAPPDAASR